MSANTFQEMANSLRLYVPQLPITLAEQFIRDRYRRILERRDWSAMRREAEFVLNASKSDGTVTVTRNSTTITGSGTSFASTDVGRQFKVGTSPVYTITAVASTTSATLDRVYGSTTAAGVTYSIFDGYITPPTDFLRFVLVVDPVQGWRLRHWITQDELTAMDPQRSSFGQPYLLADRMFNTATTPMPQYELWPYNTTARTLYYTYIKRPADLINPEDVPIWPLRSDVIVAGALADATRWPGTAQTPNPYFARPEYWKSYELQFEDQMIELERRDEEIFMTYLQQYPSTYGSFTPMSASFMQSHVKY